MPLTRAVGMAWLAPPGPRKVGLDHVERLLAAGQLGRDPVTHALADERAGQRRQHRDLALRGLGLVGADDPVAVLPAALVLEEHRRGEGDALPLGGRIDDLGGADLGLELGDAALGEGLLLARGVILGVLAEVAVRPRLGDGFRDRGAFDALEPLQLRGQLVVARARHRRALDRHGRTLPCVRTPVYPGGMIRVSIRATASPSARGWPATTGP